MFLERFIKKAFISFYIDDEKYKLFIEIIKNHKIIETETKEFENKKELTENIRELQDDYPQHYISTFFHTINQGTIPGCTKQDFLKKEIEIENIKYICIKNTYSFYVSMYDLIKLKKEYPFNIDFIFSIFSPIDFYAKKRTNYMYVLILDNQIAIIAYKDNIPIYSDISFIQKDDISEEENEDMELLEDIDIDEEISEDIEEEAESMDLNEPENDLEKTNTEFQIMEILKNSIKEYYEHYSDDFLEKIVLLDTIEIGNTIKKLIEDELLMENELITFDLLKTLNDMARGEINV